MKFFSNDNDEQLVILLKKNEIKAFDALFVRYGKKIFDFSFSLLKNSEDSKEVVQEAFFRIWDKRYEIDSDKSFKSFLFAVSYHLIIDLLRQRLKDQKYRQFLVEHFRSNNFSPNNHIDYETLSEQIEIAVEELPEKRKKIYKLSRENNFSHKEIADQLGISAKTVENQINLSLKHLKLRLGR